MEKEYNLEFDFPPGFRFHPSDEELIINYLHNKVTKSPLPASVIADIDLYKYNPWELPKKALFGEDEWYFFSPRDRKYPNGERPNRAAASGYWKATGIDKPILTSPGSKNIGVKKPLVFYTGKPPKGVKTEWTMNEYRLLDRILQPLRLKGSMRLDDWVLCRVRKKGNTLQNTEGGYGRELMRYHTHSPIIEKMQPASTRCRTDMMIMDCLNQDCQVLALVLAGQALSPTQTTSNATFRGSTSFISFYEEGSDRVNLPVLVPSSDNSLTPLKITLGEEDKREEDLVPFEKKLKNDDRSEDFLYLLR